MYKALIVDDEPIAVESIAFMIKKNFPVVESIETCRSGKDAIEKAYQFHPDVIIMDINMPGINGLEAMKQIRMVNPTVSLIVISAFDYFDYAVEAVALDVEEYLLKPVKEAKFVETFSKVINRIEQYNENRKQSLEQQERLKMILPILEKGFMHSLCMYGADTKELQDYCSLFGYENTSGYVMAIEFSQNEKSRNDNQSNSPSNSSVMNRLGAGIQGENMYEDYKKIIKSSCNGIISPIMLNRIIVYVFDDHEEESYEQKSKSVRTAQKIIERAARIYPDIYIGIGRYHKEINNAKKSYQEALHALRILTQSEDNDKTIHGRILHEDDIVEKNKYLENDYEQMIKEEIYARVAASDESTVLLAFEQIFGRMCSDQKIDFDAIKKYMIGLVVGFSKRWESNVDKEYYTVLSEIIGAADKDRLIQIGKRYISEAMHQIVKGRQKKTNSIIEKANQYIEDHYCEEILLEDVAKAVNLSSYYFSRFYKDIAGINFSDKLVNVRIDKAKELLKREDLSIKDVSYMVGYMEPNYFSKLFKKATGLTASEYKKMYGL